MRYLAYTRELGHWYSRGDEGVLEAFFVRDWGGSMNDLKSTTAMFFGLGLSTISWISKKQEIVALSMTEVEYVAFAVAAWQIVWLRRILQDCGCEMIKPTKL